MSVSGIITIQWRRLFISLGLVTILISRVFPRKMRKHHGTWRFGFSAAHNLRAAYNLRAAHNSRAAHN